MKEQNRFIPLDSTSEIIRTWERDGFPQTDWTAFSFQGSCDIPAFEAALKKTLPVRPFFQSHLIVRSRFLLQSCYWQPMEEPCQLEVNDLRHMEKRPADIEQWLQETLSPALNRMAVDLAQVYPVRFLLILLPESSGVFAIVWHHTATDGGGLYDFLRTLFAEYHRLITGSNPDWADVAGLHAQAGNVSEIRPPRWNNFFREAITQIVKYPPHKTAQPASSPSHSRGRKIIRHYFDDPVLQKALRERARQDGGTVSDLCIAAAKLALQDWNESRGKPSEVMYHGLAVNQRLRQPVSLTAVQTNPLIAIGIPSRPEDRKDPQTLLHYVVHHRRRMLDTGYDVALHRLTQGMMRYARLLPISMRYPALRLVMDHPISFFLSNVGIVWPRIENGKPTGETAIRQIGAMELLDVHTSIGTTFNNPIGLILRTFMGRLCFTFTIGRHRITDEDALAFTRLVIDKVIRYL